MQETFHDAALVLVGHGSTKNADSSVPVFQHVAELRRRGIFAEVREAFWKQPPELLSVLGGLARKRVFIVPLFVSEGYFSAKVIPRALGFSLTHGGDSERVRKSGDQSWYYCRPVGTHASMTEVLLSRAQGVLEQFPFPRKPPAFEVTLFIAGHGTPQDAESRKTVERQVELIRARKLFAAVEPLFLEEEPRIPTCYRSAATKSLVVVPLFISDGLHVAEDIPVLLGEPERIVRQRLERGQSTWRNPTEKHGKLVWLSSGVGTDPGLADVILQRVREASTWVS